jgi:nucleoside 2-deoxyribosyltransferase
MRIAIPKKIRKATTATTAAAAKAIPRKNLSVISARSEATSAEKSAFWYASDRVETGVESGRRSMPRSIPKGTVMTRKRIYLASPLGFAASTRDFMNELIPAISAHVDVENPWDDTRFDAEFAEIATLDSLAKREARLRRINEELGRSNAHRIDRSDAVFAILDGVDVDSGTAAEIGYGFARGKVVCGLRTDFRLAGDNIGAIVNLQVQYFIEASGGSIVTEKGKLVDLAQALAKGEIGGQ